ncbi:MAG: hypothetical protein MI923_02435 [Phycisphaerales bacterium]|nr:hypothetical protein [Phycisphaerales bacterium]
MKSHFFCISLGLCLLGGCNDHKKSAPRAPAKASTPSTASSPLASAALGLSGPYVHANLAVYLVHGEDKVKDQKYLTLQEALKQKKIVVHETGNVQELAVENVSEDVVYVQAGDIVRGGKQDRVVVTDLLVSAKSGKVPLKSFCVEQGRWNGRGREDASKFKSSQYCVPGNRMKLAVKKRKNQSDVWREVADNQAALAKKIGRKVTDGDSPTSLELTMENKAVKDSVADHMGTLTTIIDDHDDVVGYVASINGKLNCADVYSSNRLFEKLWPKLLESCAVEAVAESNGESVTSPKLEVVRSFLDDADRGKAAEEEISDRVTSITKESDDHILFEMVDRKHSGWIHRNYLNKKYKGRTSRATSGGHAFINRQQIDESP